MLSTVEEPIFEAAPRCPFTKTARKQYLVSMRGLPITFASAFRMLIAGAEINAPIQRENPLKRLLFICGKCRQRSPTAEQVFASHRHYETDAAGLSADADVELGTDQLEWATDIVVMEKAQASKLRRKFKKHLNGKRIVCLDIPDDFEYMQPELVELLEARIGRIS